MGYDITAYDYRKKKIAYYRCGTFENKFMLYNLLQLLRATHCINEISGINKKIIYKYEDIEHLKFIYEYLDYTDLNKEQKFIYDIIIGSKKKPITILFS